MPGEPHGSLWLFIDCPAIIAFDPVTAPHWAAIMNVTVRIPDELAKRLTASGADLERRALEGFALAAYQAGNLTQFELHEVLHFETRFEFDDFLKAHGITEPVTLEDVQRDLADLKAFGA